MARKAAEAVAAFENRSAGPERRLGALDAKWDLRFNALDAELTGGPGLLEWMIGARQRRAHHRRPRAPAHRLVPWRAGR